ncbi:hypothetical protein ACFXG4_42770 [Nocardia sp. NPDC059246]|uniref:hypothetical protein n=1 Tax=unclassified Nocardia TaxID=2637762 RepID=UPI00369C77FE
MNIRLQLACVYSLYVFIVVFMIGFVFLAGFVPPPSPAAGPDEIAEMFRANTLGIRLGMLLCMLSAALLLPWGGAVTVQMKRIEGRFSPLTYSWFAAQGCIVIEFIYPSMFWAVAAFRPDSAPELIRQFNDLAWLPWLGIISTGAFQAFALGILTLLDKRPEPIYPRWFGYFQLSAGFLLIPADLIIFFKHGPLAWNGILGFWIPASTAFIWLIVTTVFTAEAIKRQAADAEVESAEDDIARRLIILERRLAELS